MSVATQQSPEVLVSIPDTVVTHVLRESSSELGKGDLTLILTESAQVRGPASPTSSTSRSPVLTLTVGKAAFPLFNTTVFGTLADDMRAYVFTPEIGGEVGGYVKIILPEGVTAAESPFEKLQTRFEEVLIQHGLLKDSIEAIVDEIGKSVREGSINVAQNIRDSTKNHLEGNPPTETPVHVAGAIQSASAASVSGTQSVATAARRMSTAVNSVAGQAGAWLSGHLAPSTSPTAQTLEAVANIFESTADDFGAGSAEVHDALADAAAERVQNAYGEDAREALVNTSTSVENLGAAAGNAAIMTSGAGMATAGIQGAVGSQQGPEELDLADGHKLHGDEQDVWNDVAI